MRRASDAKAEIFGDANDSETATEADESPYVDLTGCALGEYVSFALSNRPDVVSAALALSNACLKLESVSSGAYPLWDFSSGYSQSTHNGPHFSWKQSGNASAAFRMELLLYDFGRLDAQEREARENIASSECDLGDTLLAAFEEVTTAYFTVRRNDALLAVSRTNVLQYAEHLRQAEILHGAGEVKKLDVLKARLDLSDAQLEAITASNDVHTACAKFIQTLGLQADQATRYDVIPAASDSFSQPKRDLPITSDTVEMALEFARTNAPSLMMLAAKVRAADARLDYAVADLLPSFSLDLGFSYLDPAWDFNWGVSAVQSLFTGYRKTAAVDQAIVDLFTARENLAQAEQELSYKLSVAVATRDTALQALETARVKVRQASENLADVTAQYRVGEASRIDFTDAVSSYSEALGERIKSFYAAQIAETALVRLTGRSVDYE